MQATRPEALGLPENGGCHVIVPIGHVGETYKAMTIIRRAASHVFCMIPLTKWTTIKPGDGTWDISLNCSLLSLDFKWKKET